jgi:S-adenosylmethionine synthetase
MVSSTYVLVAGEVTLQTRVEVEELTRQVIKELGYVHEELNFDHLRVTV